MKRLMKEHCITMYHVPSPQTSGPKMQRKWVLQALINPVVTRKLKLIRFVSSLSLIYHRVLQSLLPTTCQVSRAEGRE